MKTFTIALAVLVLAVVVQDACARPRGSPPRGLRRLWQRARNLRERFRDRRCSFKPCSVSNSTGPLCETEMCRDGFSCVEYVAPTGPTPTPGAEGPTPTIPDSIQVSVCLQEDTCASDEDCPRRTTCETRGSGPARCWPDLPRVRCESASSSESSESSESSSSEEMDTCREVLKEILEEQCEEAEEGQMGDEPAGDEPREDEPREDEPMDDGGLFGEGPSVNGNDNPLDNLP